MDELIIKILGLIYTALLILKPTTTCSRELLRSEDVEIKAVEATLQRIGEVEEDRSVTTDNVLCTAASQPLLTALAVVWIPIIVFTAITGQSYYNVYSDGQSRSVILQATW